MPVRADRRWLANVRIGQVERAGRVRKVTKLVRAIVPGSFDPVTNGHLDIIERAAAMFDSVLVAVARNSSKSPVFTTDERVEMLRGVCSEWPNVSIDAFEGLLVNYAFERKATVIIKGLRAGEDISVSEG